MRNVSCLSAKGPSYVPSRSDYLRRIAIKILVCFSTLDGVGLGADAENNARNFASKPVPFLHCLLNLRRSSDQDFQ